MIPWLIELKKVYPQQSGKYTFSNTKWDDLIIIFE